MRAPQVVRAPRRRGTFGLDERRWPDPARVEEALRGFLALRLPEIWVPGPGQADATGRTLALVMPRGHVAMIRIERDPGRPGPGARGLAERCAALGVPHARVSSLDEGRAALRRLGIAPPPAGPAGPTAATVFGRA